ncbi:hypothetical protein QUB68_25055 [Microcoleus sp. A006_D1]|uniref:hypothetical protein n=1 Tax=Microcoleus sp. A006_D1 TaxID=3055267 RepID=UPI002FD32098
MSKIIFAGIQGQVLESSPNGSFLVVKLSDRITICGAVVNKFDWDIAPDEDSGFESFITYIGVRSQIDADRIKPLLQQNGAYFGKDGSDPRKSKRCRSYPFELKVRGLEADFVVDCINEGLIS